MLVIQVIQTHLWYLFFEHIFETTCATDTLVTPAATSLLVDLWCSDAGVFGSRLALRGTIPLRRSQHVTAGATREAGEIAVCGVSMSKCPSILCYL